MYDPGGFDFDAQSDHKAPEGYVLVMIRPE